MPKITDTEINIKLPGGTRGIKGHPGPVGPIGPQGEPGVQGNKGIVGPKGEVGEIPTFSIGSMTIGTPASITTTGTPENNILNMVIPKGQKGDAPDSPEISFSKSGKKTTMTVDIGETTKTYEMDDGVDPSVSVSKTGNDTTITTNMYGVSKSTVVPDGEHQFTAGEGISIENREVSDTNYDYIYGDATQEHSGTSFVIQKGLEAPIDSIELKGDTYQYTTTGKNLLPNERETITDSGITITKNNDGTYKVNGTATADVSLAINQDTFVSMSGTWRMVGCPAGGSSSTYMLSAYVGYWGSGSPNIDTGNGTTITYTGNVKVRFYIKSGTQCNNLIFKPMITTDTSATYNSFEPYTNGSSPNPEFPQNIEVVTGEQEISVVGKNLILLPNVSRSLNGLTGSFDKNTITISGTNTKTDANWVFLSTGYATLPDFKPGETYTLSTPNKPSGCYLQINYYVGNTTTQNSLVTVYGEKVTFTVPSDFGSVASVFVGISRTTTNIDTTFNIQLEKGSTATDFEAYKENTYEVNLGKNLVKSARVDSATAIYNVTLFVEADLEPSTTYTISFYGTNGNRIYANENLFTSGTFINIGNDKVIITLTTKDTISKSNTGQYNSYYQKWVIFKNGKTEDSANVYNDFQIEKGSVATSYSPFRNYTKNLFGDTIRQGVTNYQTGEYSSNSSRVTSTNWTTLEAGTYTINVESTNSNPLQISCVTFDTSGNFYDITGVSGQWKTLPLTFTTPISIKWKCNLSYSNGASITPSNVKNIQLEKGNQKTSYVPYMSQIELCKIGTYKDYIKKSSGKNLLDVATAESGKYYSGNYIDNSENWLIQQVPVKPNTNYYLSGNNKNNNSAKIWLLDENKNQLSLVGGYYDTHLITTTNTTKYIGVSIADYNGTADKNTIMLNEGSTALPYEPYGTGWYLCKNIGKVVLNGSESWGGNASGGFYTEIDTLLRTDNYSQKMLCNNFTIATNHTSQTFISNKITGYVGTGYIGQNWLYLKVEGITSSSDLKTWLSTHNTTVYYVLNTPTYIEIVDEELISQLESIWTVDGINNINIATSYLPAYAKITSYNKNANGMLSSIIKMTEILEERSNN